MDARRLILDTCKELSCLWKELERRDRSLAEQGRRAMQSMVLQYGEGLHAYGKHRTAKLLGARAEAHEARLCLELAAVCGLLDEHCAKRSSDALDHIAAVLWLKVHRPH